MSARRAIPMRRGFSSSVKSHVRVGVLTLMLSSGCVTAWRPLSAQQSAGQALKERVEQLRVSGILVLGGEAIGAPNLIAALYEENDFAPLWTRPRAAGDLQRLVRAVEADGLNPADYHLAAITARSQQQLTPPEAAEIDLLRTSALIRVVYDLRAGKANPARSGRNAFPEHIADFDPALYIRRMLDADNVYDAVIALRPAHFVYRGLVSALAGLRQVEEAGGWPLVPGGPSLRPDSVDRRIPQLRQRLSLESSALGGASGADTRYDRLLEIAVKSFQHTHALNPDGIVGAATIAELNVPIRKRMDQVRINLDRARWVTHDLPDTFVAVNAAGAMVYLVKQGNVAFESRAVVGKTYTRTPVFRAEMRYIDLNPTWTVPPGIVGEILSALRRDPEYLREQGMRVLGGSGTEVNTSAASLARYSARGFPFTFRQDPGPLNPLGQIKFVFPNPYNVYLHDTPSRTLFEREERAFSHGCIRVQNPLELATLLLDDPGRWNPEAIRAAIATGATRTVPLKKPVPVLVLYWTASADLHGELHFYRDVYGRDAAVLRALD